VSEVQDKISGSGQIAYYVAESLEPVYREIAGLLGVSLGANLRVALDADQEASPGKQATPSQAVPQHSAEMSNREKMPNRWLLSNVDAILVEGISLTRLKELLLNYSEQQAKPLLLVCGPVSGENPGFRLKTFSFSLGTEGTRLLMEGRDYTEKGVGEPSFDLMLEEIREVLRREVRNYLELPPVPWGYAYAMTLTHDIDILSLKEMPIARTFLGYFYRSSLLNWKRWRSGKVKTAEFYRTIWEMVRTWAAKVGLGQDVWQRALPALLDLEKRLEVRSSLYFMPFPEKPGILPEHLREAKESAPANRAAFYDVAKYQTLLAGLEDGGWEAGVHGIDAWHDAQSARAEHGRVAGLTGRDELGVRMHWLYFQSPDSFEALGKGGFQYDATFGFNEVIGFRAGTLQPYHPLNCQTLWELPLHIQDGALMGEEHLNLNREDAFRKAQPILDFAKRFGGAVSLLWHNQSFTAPRFWGEVYERLIVQGREDGAWIALPRDVLRWFTGRRRCRVELAVKGTHWQISCDLADQERIPLAPSRLAGQSIPVAQSTRLDLADLSATSDPLVPRIPPIRIRLQIEPKRVKSISVPYEVGEGYIDFPAQTLIRLEVEGED